jgi:hypothetical protein
MNYLVFLDTHAGELEKILCGVKCMLVKEIKSSQSSLCPVSQGDSLYFLRDKDEHAVRVKATVVRVFSLINSLDEDLAQLMKELQPKLQLTEDQYNHWSTQKQILLVEFDCAQKISLIQVAENIVIDTADWIPFEEFSQIT